MNAATKIDVLNELKALYLPSAKQVVAVDVPAIRYLMIDGVGDPDTSPAYAAALDALYGVSYTAKFAIKKERGADYRVMPLEGLWWSDDQADFTAARRDRWQWTMMIHQPDLVSDADLHAAIAQTSSKKPEANVSGLRVEELAEGRCAQILHVGPFSTEGPTIARVHEFIAAQGAQLRGKHHEIYLSDIRRADPARWKTVIRQPMTR